MSDDAMITLDVLTSGEVWHNSSRIASKSAEPFQNAAKSLRAMGIPLNAVLIFRKLGQVVRWTSIGFVLREL
jgi:hypothetical protein